MLRPFLFNQVIPVLIRPPIMFIKQPYTNIRQNTQPPISHAVMLIRVHTRRATLVSPRVRGLRPIMLITRAQVSPIKTHVHPTFQVSPTYPHPRQHHVQVQAQRTLTLRFTRRPPMNKQGHIPPINITTINSNLPTYHQP